MGRGIADCGLETEVAAAGVDVPELLVEVGLVWMDVALVGEEWG